MNKLSVGHRNILLLGLGAALAAACGQSKGDAAKPGPSTPIVNNDGGGGRDSSSGSGNTSGHGSSSGPGSTGAGGGAAKATGSPCTANGECVGAECVSEMNDGWPSGYCSGECVETCEGGAVCAGGSCFAGCVESSDCRDAYACRDLGNGSMVCVPACTSDAQCPATGDCTENNGLCAPAPEAICNDFKDNDNDDLTDCEDSSCQAQPVCQPGDKDVGEPCSASSDCKATGGDPMCMTEPLFGYPQGSCSEFCVVGQDGQCSGSGVCVDMGLPSGGGLCVEKCAADADCTRAGYACEDDGSGIKACRPHCTDDAECSDFCNADTFYCSAATEDCANDADDDDDQQPDCQDKDCDATCGPLLESACNGAAQAKASNQGDTTGGTQLYGGSCTGDAGTEQIFAYTPGAVGQVGTLSVTLHSQKDMGVYVRTACRDEGTEIGCRDAEQAGGDETLKLSVRGGEPLAIFVDGFQAGQEGTFTLDLDFQAAVCGDGTTIAPEECDDGNTSSGDGCSAACTVEQGSFCDSAPALLAGNDGDTNGGSSAFEASCTGGGGALESIYSYTPPSDGMLDLVLESESDQGLYVRTACNNEESSEIGCTDWNPGGQDESLTVQVTGGVPIYIFVDGYLSPAEAGPFSLRMTFNP